VIHGIHGRRARVVFIAVALGLLFTGCTGASSRRSSSVDDNGYTWIREPFKVHAGDELAWSSLEFDDRDWPTVDSRLLPGTTIADWEGLAWFRGWVEIPPELSGHPIPIVGRFAGASEVFVDGNRAFAYCDPTAVLANGVTPVDFAAEMPRWITFPQPGRHLIAVRFASKHLTAMHRVGFPAGFDLALGSDAMPSQPSRSPNRLFNPIFVGAAGALALLHFLLFLFHRDRRENLYYALAAAGVACITVFDGSLRRATTAAEAIALLGAFGAAVTISAVLMLRFYYALFASKLPRTYWIFAAFAVVIAATSWTTPRAVAYGFAAIVAVVQFRVLFGAIARGSSGAWIIGAGGVLSLLGSALQMLGDLGLLPHVWGAYLFGFLALLGSMSIYLARDIARDKADLARQLVELSQLAVRQQQAMERYRTIFETTGTATIMFGDDALISLANDEWAKLTGYSREEIQGRMTWTAFFSEKSLEKLKGYDQIPAENASIAPRTYEAELCDRRGRIHEGVVTINMVRGTGERVGSFLDLTDLKRAQKQMVRAEKMASLGQIVAGVAHEINNPNNFIHFNLPILRRYVDAMRSLLEMDLEREPNLELLNMRYDEFMDDLFKLIDNMAHGSSRITSIVSDLKHYVRSGEDLEMTEGSIAKVIERAIALCGKQVQQMVKRVDVEIANDLPLVKMNAGKIEQVLINLLINAGQAADKDASWVKLEARVADTDGAVEILVKDNGAGITLENTDQIFEPFFTTKNRETGTGLGLSISQRIVEEHGGRIELVSEVGVGSTFTVWLPAAPGG